MDRKKNGFTNFIDEVGIINRQKLNESETGIIAYDFKEFKGMEEVINVIKLRSFADGFYYAIDTINNCMVVSYSPPDSSELFWRNSANEDENVNGVTWVKPRYDHLYFLVL